jgi:ribonucleoside-diphosphate reductase alpha chain
MYDFNTIQSLNGDINLFPHVYPITDDMKNVPSGVSKLVMMDRYTYKDIEKLTLKENDIVVLTVKEDPKFPSRGLGRVVSISYTYNKAMIKVEQEYEALLEDPEEAKTGIVTRNLDSIEKPLELYWEQIALRNARGLSEVENEDIRPQVFDAFYKQLSEQKFIPAGRVLYGAGAGTDVTYFNCYVMPFPEDSRGGLSDHRKEVMEIMSRGGGVGTNGSTLRPRNTLAKGVNGKSSGSVTWLDDIAKLTHLVEQGGSRRGAQMIMLSDWHPDIMEFVVSKMQNPKILKFIIDTTKDEEIKQLAKDKLKFTPYKKDELADLNALMHHYLVTSETAQAERIDSKIKQGGTYEVENPEFLTGANISVALTHEFMKAVEEDDFYELRFPDVENYTKEEMKVYDEEWHKHGDVREWEALGRKVRVYRKIRAKELWNLINIAATYSAEPGIFFIDNANDKTNATAYGQRVVATNPCGEQPLAPYSVCNLAAVNLAKFANKETKTVNYDELRETVSVGIRMQDNVISATPYFLEANQIQALGERRIGLGVMGLHDLLIYCEVEYGSEDGNDLTDKIFEVIATTAYEASIDLAKEKGSFPFLEDYKIIGKDFSTREAFVNSGFMQTMPEHIREDIVKYGIRNSHLLTVAPTGSTGTLVGVSTGLEPYYSFSYFRSGRLGKFIPVVADIAVEWLEANGYEGTVENMGYLPPWFIASQELTPEAHVDAQCTIQRWIDSSLSKTVNAPKGYTVEQVAKVYERLHKGGAKGGTVYVDGSRDAQVLSLTNEENTFDNHNEESKFEVYVDDTAQVVGNNVGDICPVCTIGTIEDIGGCHTCTNCKAQLICGL